VRSPWVVTPLPPETVEGSLYAEGGDGLRVLSTRFRARAVKDDARAAVRAGEDEVRGLEAEAERIKKAAQVLQQNLDFLQKLENFTGATMQGVAEKGMLNGETTIRLTTFVMEARAEKSAALVEKERALKENAEAIELKKRQLAELAAGSSRTEFDAVIVAEKAEAPAATLRLSYLVGAATWQPRYRLRAGGDKDPVRLEYLAAIEQRSGEDWRDARVTLSTAQPSLNATLPDLVPLDIAVVEEGAAPRFTGRGMGGGMGMMGGGMGMIGGGVGGGIAVGPGADPAREALRKLAGGDAKAGAALLNRAAALHQAEELQVREGEAEPEKGRDKAAPPPGGGPGATYHLVGRLTVPSRKDPQLVEVARFETAPEFFAKAVPVLSPRVYRLARLTNNGDSVLLPGEATMYVGPDFVGRMALPQVAVGEPFTVGFGVDPQLQVGRRLVAKSQAVQGGNQVQSFEFRIVVRNFKSTPVALQVWDRLPHPKSTDVAVNLASTSPDLSPDALYRRAQRPDNLLRWDLDVPPGTTGEKALTIHYQFQLEFAREMAVDYLATGGLMEAPIGGMSGMGGGMR
jgi:hypothetical protein